MFKSTEKNRANKELLISTIVFGVIAYYISLCLGAAAMAESLDIFDLLSQITPSKFFSYLNPIFMFSNITPTSFLYSSWVVILIVLMLISFYLDGRRRNHDMEGIEQGSAKWTINTAEEVKKQGKKFKEPKLAADYRKNMMSEEYTDNIMFDNTYGLSMDTRKTRRNLHMLVIGGSGAGKTRFFVKPNILQMNSSYIITDPSGELYRDMGKMLEDNNYDVRVFNTFDPNMSMQYNPLKYIRSDSDVTSMITTLIKNTGESSGDNKYFDDATKLLLSAIILFLIHHCPKEERDFAHIMQLVVAADVPEGAKSPQSELDKIFENVKKVDPNGLAMKMYKSFKSTSGKSLKAVLSSTATRLTVFNYQEIERLTCADTISLSTIGDEKTALFIITPPTDNGFNFLVAMMYSQLFSTLYYHTTFECRYLVTDNKYITRPYATKEEAEEMYNLLIKQHENPNEKIIEFNYDPMIEKYEMIEVATKKVWARELREETKERFLNSPNEFEVKQNTKEEAGSPFHIRMLMDEFANINEIPDFSEVLATVRKYNMSVVIILQSLAQLKKRYEKDYEPIIDNCDTLIFLGSKGQETTEYISKMLGNMTITTRGAGESMGKNKSTSYNYSQQKRELLNPNELAMVATNEQIVCVRAVNPFKIPKFVLEKHPNFNQSADGDGERLIIQRRFNLEEKIKRINESNGIVTNETKQVDINEGSQQSVEKWMSASNFGASTSQEDDDMDTFRF